MHSVFETEYLNEIRTGRVFPIQQHDVTDSYEIFLPPCCLLFSQDHETLYISISIYLYLSIHNPSSTSILSQLSALYRTN